MSGTDPPPAAPRPDRSAPPGDAWREAHGAQVTSALESGDPAAIKRLYADLGHLLEDTYRGDLDGIPQLSLPETVPVVAGLLRGVTGLLLDAGCGPNPVASITLALAEPDRTLIGLDLGLGTVRLARGRADRAGVDLQAVVADLEHLPFRSGSVAGVVCDDTIEHVPQDSTAVRELCRVTRASGPVVLATPNRHSLAVLVQRARDLARGRRRAPEAYFVAESHLREYTWTELTRLVAPVATIDRRVGVGWGGGRLRGLASWLTARPGLRRVDRMLVARLIPRRGDDGARPLR